MRAILWSILTILTACVVQPHPSTAPIPGTQQNSYLSQAPVWKVRKNIDTGNFLIAAWDTPQRAELIITCIPDDLRPYLLDPAADRIVVIAPLAVRPAEQYVERVRSNYRIDQNQITEAPLDIEQLSAADGGGFVVGLTGAPASEFLRQLSTSAIGVSVTLADGQVFSYRMSAQGRDLINLYNARPCPWR